MKKSKKSKFFHDTWYNDFIMRYETVQLYAVVI